jgi:hypothetical protein
MSEETSVCLESHVLVETNRRPQPLGGFQKVQGLASPGNLRRVKLGGHKRFPESAVKEENRILRARLPERLVATDQEKRRLLRCGRKLGLQRSMADQPRIRR